jgi:type IV secretory pathway VirD2 relaxase
MIAKGSGYVRGNRQAAAARLTSHMKYTEHRSRDLEQETRDDRRIFSKEEDVVSRKDAVEDVMEHTSTSVNYHKVILSPDQDEYIADWREWTRDVMQDLEESQGRELHWYAVKHDNTDNPHVHVVIAGAGENLETGELEPVKLYTSDYQLMRESGHDHSDYEHYHHISELVKEYDSQEHGELTPERDQSRDVHQPDLDRGDFDR